MYNTAWPFRTEPSSGHAVPTAAVCGFMERIQQVISYMECVLRESMRVAWTVELWRDAFTKLRKGTLTFWRRNYFFNFSTHCI